MAELPKEDSTVGSVFYLPFQYLEGTEAKDEV
jgi:hypothetical protein